jgi:glutamine amidotransferase
MIVIIDYGMGNLGSIHNMLFRLGKESLISSNKMDILRADKLVLPGVGSFDRAVTNLRELDIISVLNEKVIKEETSILGICLGMQLMTLGSEEGVLEGLGWIDAKTVRFKFDGTDQRLKIPHMGWNRIKIMRSSGIFDDLSDEARFYFVHSYYVRCRNEENILAQTEYGIQFTSAIIKDNILATQFHPEKSHKYGLQLLKNFVDMKP